MMRRPLTKLTDMQARYLWLMGSYPSLIMIQGRGYRTERLMYAIRDDELIIFGYSNPAFWLSSRGLIKPLQAPNSYALTDEGTRVFTELVARGVGMKLNKQIREVA